MNTIETLVLVFHVLGALAIIGLVLIQHGKGADMGAGFGSGSSSTVFGSDGAGNFLTRLTTGVAIAFFVSSFTLAVFAKQKSGVVQDLGIPVVEEAQQAPAAVDEELPAFEDDGYSTEESEIPE